MTLSKAIRKLEERELGRREPSTTDTRAAIEVRFTNAGRKLVHPAIIAVEGTDDEFFACLSAQQMKYLKALAISIIIGNCERLHASGTALHREHMLASE